MKESHKVFEETDWPAGTLWNREGVRIEKGPPPCEMDLLPDEVLMDVLMAVKRYSLSTISSQTPGGPLRFFDFDQTMQLQGEDAAEPLAVQHAAAAVGGRGAVPLAPLVCAGGPPYSLYLTFAAPVARLYMYLPLTCLFMTFSPDLWCQWLVAY